MDIAEAAKKAQEIIDKEEAGDPKLRKALKVVREFIQTHPVICYGGTAINNLLPQEDRFYDPTKDIPDYDFFSKTPQVHSAKIADRLVEVGSGDVEVKPGVHLGTYKVFANYIGVADISMMEPFIFDKIWKDSIVKKGVHYAPPNYLRMAVYLELSRPKGFVERWPKVYSRLQLLNKHYPMTCPKETEDESESSMTPEIRKKVEDVIIKHQLVLLGFNASMIESGNNNRISSIFKSIFRGSITKEYPEYGELLPPHTDVDMKKTLVRIYETQACHSYHEMSNKLRIASIPTLLQFFLSVQYASKHFVEDVPEQRFLCTAEHLINLANRYEKRRNKLLTPITCLGKQQSLLDMRIEKTELWDKVKDNQNSREFLEYFFSYKPGGLSKTERRRKREQLSKTLRNRRQ
jgi:Poly(A) polymerase catalytic subunit